MHPYLIRIGGFSVPSYPTIYGLGITLAGVVLLILGKREGYNVRKLSHIILILTFSIMIGGRAFYVFQHVDDFRSNWREAFYISQGGQVFYGGLMVVIPCVIVYCKLVKLPIGRIFDFIVVGAPLGLAVGRWACFCRGCCFGRITDWPWAVQFPKHIDLAGNITGSPAFLKHLESGLISESILNSLAVHPAQIYSSIMSLLVFFIMLWFLKSNRLKGYLIFVYLIIYAISRFIIEFFRDNEMAFWDLTIPQVVSGTIAIVSFIAFMLIRYKFDRKRLILT